MKTSGNGLAYAAIGGGAILAWSGIKGKQFSAVLRSLLSGKDPSNLPSPDQLTSTGVPGTGSGGIPASDSAILNDAMTYVGVPYKWAGYTRNGHDCSGFVGEVLGKDFGMPLPIIGHWSGNYHPSVAASYLTWTKAVTIPESQAVGGDLCVWPTHIGFVSGHNEMVSALSPKYGTAVTPIHGFGPLGEPVTFRRIKYAGSGPGPRPA